MTRRLIPLTLLAPLLLCAGDTALERATLKGAKSVAVVIDALPNDFPKEGVTADALRVRITNRLRDAGIPVDDAAKEFAGLRIASVRDTHGLYALTMTLAFYQPATLVRDPSIRVAPQTWDADATLMAGSKVLQRAAMENADDLADRFIAAWRSVNAPEPQK